MSTTTWTNKGYKNLLGKGQECSLCYWPKQLPCSHSELEVWESHCSGKLIDYEFKPLWVLTTCKHKKGMSFTGQGIKVWWPWPSRSQMSLHSISGVTQPLLPHHSTDLQEESWNQLAIEIQILACNLVVLEAAWNLFYKTWEWDRWLLCVISSYNILT